MGRLSRVALWAGMGLMVLAITMACEHGHEHEHEHGHEHEPEPEPEHEHEHAEGLIELGLEAQAQLGFRLAPVARRGIQPAFRASAWLRPSPGGESVVAAPATGRVLTTGEAFPVVGQEVAAGQELLVLAAHLNDDADPAGLELAVAEARARSELARRELRRLAGLFEDGAVPERRLQEARSEEAVARAGLVAARQRLRQYQEARAQEGGGAPRMSLSSPVAGTVVSVAVSPGAFVKEGEALVHVVDRERLWLEVQVPESEAALAHSARGVWFETGAGGPVLEVDGPPVSVGGRIAAAARSLPLWFALPPAAARLPVGMYVTAHVRLGEARQVLAVPAGAILREGAESVVFVRQDERRFARRAVSLGERDSGYVEIRGGLAEGETVVAAGAYALSLAGDTPAAAGHGHAH